MFILFFLFWVMLNGRITVEIAIFGVVISAALYAFICKFMNFSVAKDLKIVRKLPLIIWYCLVLVKEIIAANIVMARYIISLEEVAEPALVKFHVDFKTHIAEVILANSITLTPGTITVEMADGEYLVHCYDKGMAEGIDSSVFVNLLRKLEA